MDKNPTEKAKRAKKERTTEQIEADRQRMALLRERKKAKQAEAKKPEPEI
jgi:hypothetical protein